MINFRLIIFILFLIRSLFNCPILILIILMKNIFISTFPYRLKNRLLKNLTKQLIVFL